MRIHRIRLRDFKGVDDAEIEFAEDRVTIIEGPNEVGKTSFAEALTLVLEQLDSSTRGDIRNAKPVHNDAGPWVEVELSTGPYRLIIEKRWISSRMTHLRVLEPKAEEVTGREGHDRLREILAETLDEQLFRALHHYQGVAVEQADLGKSTSLSSALNAAASGQSLAGQKEASLIDLVQKEWLRYFTPTGKSISERTQTEKDLVTLRGEIETARAGLDALDGLADDFDSLTSEIARLRDEQVTKQQLLDQESKLWDSVQSKKVIVAQATSAHTTTVAAENEAKRRLEDRTALRDTEVSTASALAEAEREAEKDRPALEAARLAVEQATRRRDDARKSRSDAVKAEQEAKSHEEYHDRLISRDLWSERLSNVQWGQSALTEAQAVLSRNLVDDEQLELLEAAALAVTEARAHLSASSAEVRVEALTDISISTSNESRSLKSGEAFEERVDGMLSFQLADVARVTVTGGSPERILRDVLEEAERRFHELLAAVDLSEETTIAECRLVAQQRRDAVASEVQATKLIADNVRDLTVDRLEQQVADAGAFINAFQKKHGSEVSIPESLEDARSILGEASRATASAAEDVDATEHELEAAHARGSEVKSASDSRATNRQVCAALHDGAVEALRLARELQGDEALDTTLEESTRNSEIAGEQLSIAEGDLNDLDPESVEARLSNLKFVVERLTKESVDAGERLVAVRTTLSVEGEKGLHDRLDELESTLERKSRSHERTERAADALDLLWKRLVSSRDQAQRSYIAPYRTEIERLGRIVYGPTFAVEVDHSALAVENRTLHGRTIPFDLLSIGAKEQLCVMARLACAGIVAGGDEHGVPVIIDDALGWTDPKRLARIEAAIPAASRDCQVIVLTCDPARYSSVGNAIVRHLNGRSVDDE